MNNKPLFEQYADATLDAVRATYAQRGGEYADTIGTIQPITLQSILAKLGLPKLDRDALVALIAAALVDVKYWRGLGGWKEDSMIDGIAYQALLVGAVKWLEGREAEGAKVVAEFKKQTDAFIGKINPKAEIAKANQAINEFRKEHGLDAKRGEPPINPGMTYFNHNAGRVDGGKCVCDICEVYRTNNP